MAVAFVDTNILLYAASNAPSERAKSAAAQRLLRDQEIALSTQVLQEFYWVVTRPTKMAFTHQEALVYIAVWKRFPVQAISLAVVEDALFLCQKFRISYWDAAIVAAARQLGCQTLYTEDLSDGQDYGGVKVINPFVPEPSV